MSRRESRSRVARDYVIAIDRVISFVTAHEPLEFGCHLVALCALTSFAARSRRIPRNGRPAISTPINGQSIMSQLLHSWQAQCLFHVSLARYGETVCPDMYGCPKQRFGTQLPSLSWLFHGVLHR